MQTEINERLSKIPHPTAFLATVDQQGAPQVRPVTLMVCENKFYLATSSHTRKAIEIGNDSRVEFVTPLPEGQNTGYLRVMGHAERITDSRHALQVTQACDFPVDTYFGSVEAPGFFFCQVKPTRVEYMKPGNMRAIEVTDEYTA
ncbi:MAG: pyridoxamine 5'-phosphate oxidase family protein [candidate division Zixibacteria bacterium]|nr:pyridoxamine 5'-phosphate oxidase family protein [candidate division Zixibacteria bacterium]